MRFHFLANLFPQLDGQAFEELADDIAANGLREPIVLLDGEVLDGRNRLRACEARGVEPRFADWLPGPGDTAEAFVISANLRRRHLNESERAMIGARLVRNPFGQDGTPKTTAGQAAALMNVATGQVQRGRRVLKKGVPELVAAVDSGLLTVRGAADIAAKPPEEQRAALADPQPKRRRVVIHSGNRPMATDDGKSLADLIGDFTDMLNSRPREVLALNRDLRIGLAHDISAALHLVSPRQVERAGLHSNWPI